MSKHLVPGEQVRIRTRAHSGALIGPAVWLILLAGLTGLWQGFMSRPDLPETMQYFRGQLSIGGVALIGLLLIPSVVIPVFNWASTVFELTTQRVAQRVGIFSVRRRWMALVNIAHIQLRQTRRQRWKGSADIQLFTHSGQAWILRNVPEAAQFLHYIDVERFEISRSYGYGNQGAAWGRR